MPDLPPLLLPHAIGCPLTTHGGTCTCPDLVTTSRDLTYLIAGVAEGHYPEDDDE